MVQNFTLSNLLIKQLYKEINVDEKLMLGHILQNDPSSLTEFSELHKAKWELPQIEFMPKKSLVDSILSYSKVVC